MPEILVVGADNLITAHRAALSAHGLTVIGAAGADAAIERLREGGIDVVLLDPPIAGPLEALAAALQSLPDPPPLLLLSGAPDAPLMSARLGVAAFLPKPCALPELVRVIGRLVSPRGIPTAIDDQPTTPREKFPD